MIDLFDPTSTGFTDAVAKLEAAEAAEAGQVIEHPHQRVQREDGSLAPARGKTDAPHIDLPADKPASRADESRPSETPEAGKSEIRNPKSEQKPEGQKPDGQQKPQDQTKPADQQGQQSRYTKSQERLQGTWKEVNERKTQLDTREQQLQAREAQLGAREKDIESRARRTSSQYTPEQYEQAAAQRAQRAQGLHREADGLEARAKAAEDDGKYVEAARLQDQAKRTRAQANHDEFGAADLKAAADQQRRNPAPSYEQETKQLEASRKEWTTKAAVDFPDLVKAKSPLQVGVVQAMNDLAQRDPEMGRNPRAIYYAARMVSAELQAARVAGLEKELGTAKARVSELEKLSAPIPGGGSQRMDTNRAPTEEEERAALREESIARGSF